MPEIWTNLSYAYSRVAAYGWSPSRPESLRLAREAGDRAVALDPRSADAHYVLGFAVRMQGDIDRALAEYETAVTLNPNHAPGHAGIGQCWLLRGRPREALPYFDRAFRVSPHDPLRAVWHAGGGLAYMLLGDDLKALDEGKRSAAANPQFPLAFSMQASALALLGRKAEARATLAFLQQLQPRFTLTSEQRRLSVPAGDNPEFHRLIERYYDGLRKAGLPE